MRAFPITSLKHYLTGQAALNVPSKSGDFADWHFTEVFLSGRGKLPVAGRDFPYAQQKVCAANHASLALLEQWEAQT
jgi:hypothetical protein